MEEVKFEEQMKEEKPILWELEEYEAVYGIVEIYATHEMSAFESLDLSNREIRRTKPSLKVLPSLGLKNLPTLLSKTIDSQYNYLGDNNTSPVIISAQLSKTNEELLL